MPIEGFERLRLGAVPGELEEPSVRRRGRADPHEALGSLGPDDRRTGAGVADERVDLLDVLGPRGSPGRVLLGRGESGRRDQRADEREGAEDHGARRAPVRAEWEAGRRRAQRGSSVVVSR